MSKKILKLSTGKNLAYKLYGAGCNDIVLFHGLIGSAVLSDKTVAEINKFNVRIISIERPGYGESDCIDMNNVADWQTIFFELVSELKLSKIDLIGISAGAPYAYATACYYNNIVNNLYILAGVPAVFLPDIIKHYPKEAISAYEWYKTGSYEELQNYFCKIMQNINQDTSLDLESLKHAIADSAKNNCCGMAREAKLQILPWDFKIADLKNDIFIYHSPKDTMVPFKANEEMSRLLPNSKLIIDQTDYDAQSAHHKSIQQNLARIFKQYT